MTKHNSKLLPHLYDTCLSFVFALKLSTVSQRFPGNLCMISWTRSWSLTSASQRASFSSTPSSGRDRWGVFFTWHLYTYFISNLASTRPSSFILDRDFGINSFLSCYSAVCRRIAPRTSPADCVHLLCCWRSSRFQHYCNTHPEIVSHHIQKLCVFNLIHVYCGWVPETSRKSSPTPWECLL